MAALEAAACGVPTVATRVGALGDHPAIVTTVPPGDVAALADAVRACPPGPRPDIRAAALAAYTVQTTADRLRGLYAGL
jgi:glycosyltransferase involved in cell wall biosynthesis